MGEDSNSFDFSFPEDYYNNNINKSYKNKKEENFEDIFKGSEYFSLNKKDDDFVEKEIYGITSKKSEEEKINKIFITKRTEKENINKKGRRNSKESSLFKPKHDKNSSDNIRKKIKRQFIKSIMNYINKLYTDLQNNKNSEKLIYKIIPEFSNSPKREDEKYLPMTLSELFSSDLGNKFTKFNKNYNKNKIELLYQKNKPKEIIDLLNKTIKEAYEIYINNKIPEFSLDNDLKEIEKEKGIEEANILRKKAKKLIDNQKKNKK